MRRRTLLASLLLPQLGHALPARALVFPRDFGSHPEFRTEWWYVTGALRSGQQEFGFQVTFFRSRVDVTRGMASRFAARQLLFAHAAVTDVAGKRLLHDQRIAREGFGVAVAAQDDTRLKLRDWSLARAADRYRTRIPAGEFLLDLEMTPTQPLLLQGDAGLSRKGPLPQQASYYYSLPQLRVQGSMAIRGRQMPLSGTAWLDHEWSEELLHPDAVGWDWIGMNFEDGRALTAFQLRRRDGSALWDGGSFRDGAHTRIAKPGETRFTAVRKWTSSLSRATYPVEWRVSTLAGEFTVRALVDEQELDSRASTGAIYWEGLSDLLDTSGRRVGRGYLEMTGYAERLRM